MTMKISIITVAYNCAATIADTLASVRSQTYADIEHIVVDGGSTDGTVELVGRLGRPDTVLLSEPDKGIYDAMNKGLRLATGEVIGCLNADDVFADEQVVADIARAAAAGAQAVYGDLVYVAQDQLDKVVRHWRSGAFTPSRLAFGWMPPHPTLYFRRALLPVVGEYDTSFRIAADYDYVLRLLRQPDLRVHYLPRVLIRMRLGGVSNRSLRTVLQKSREDLRALRQNRAGGLFTLLCKNLRKLPQFL
jgi:glycosyltransferase